MSEAAELTFDSSEWKRLLRKVQQKWSDVQNRKAFGGVVSSLVYADIMDHFAREQGPKGRWKAWSKAYAEHMKEIGQENGLLLQRSPANLRMRFQPESWRGQKDGILFYNNAKVKGSGFPYAYAHDTGGPKLPQRQFMWLSAKGMNKIVKQVERWLNEES